MLHLLHRESPITQVLQAHYNRLDEIANSWLRSGATSYSILYGHQTIMTWADEPFTMEPGIVASVSLHQELRLEIRITGRHDEGAYHRLTTEAQIISDLLKSEEELNSLTDDLIANQDQLLALYDLASSLRSNFDLENSLQLLAKESCRLVGAESASILLETGPTSFEIQHTEKSTLNKQPLVEFLWQIKNSRRHLHINQRDKNSNLSKNIRNLLAVPIRIQNEIKAILVLVNKSPSFNSINIKLANTLTEQAGAHIENILLHAEIIAKTRMQTEMEMARQLQIALLPDKSPSLQTLDVFGESIPASHVGGDFYDFIERKDQSFVFTIGDVSGKGLAAAMLMTMTRTAFQTLATDPKNTPKDIIHQINANLYDDFTRTGKFTTAFLGSYCPISHEFTYVNAGQSPIIYCPADGEARILEADGTALGVLPECFCENQTIQLSKGDLLIASTDGFSEAQDSEGTLFGYDRLLQLVTDHKAQDAEQLAKTLQSTIHEFADKNAMQDDDQTLVILKRKNKVHVSKSTPSEIIKLNEQ